MTCLDQMDRWFVQVPRPGLLESRAPYEAEMMVLFSAASAEPWCF